MFVAKSSGIYDAKLRKTLQSFALEREELVFCFGITKEGNRGAAIAQGRIKGGPGTRAPSLPPTEGLPQNRSYFIFR